MKKGDAKCTVKRGRIRWCRENAQWDVSWFALMHALDPHDVSHFLKVPSRDSRETSPRKSYVIVWRKISPWKKKKCFKQISIYILYWTANSGTKNDARTVISIGQNIQIGQLSMLQAHWHISFKKHGIKFCPIRYDMTVLVSHLNIYHMSLTCVSDLVWCIEKSVTI